MKLGFFKFCKTARVAVLSEAELSGHPIHPFIHSSIHFPIFLDSLCCLASFCSFLTLFSHHSFPFLPVDLSLNPFRREP
ncbi:hypothetical protein BDQ94DRAFT_152602 [Aspergillus welwitschiae]|uniref:Uncharacterized protein n=1 Tax=Aspergillus welwitschiae TaxID=1341132 RepID=A0A3F3PMG8_9EURO|nr:hypothetical protein BDQ94DRAFT_152602 [Aspergillus welwitschiae]RDH28130.1 hypothetical protein BDQ94DRAFT_152602 [Aspergillus welwitschiae]